MVLALIEICTEIEIYNSIFRIKSSIICSITQPQTAKIWNYFCFTFASFRFALKLIARFINQTVKFCIKWCGRPRAFCLRKASYFSAWICTHGSNRKLVRSCTHILGFPTRTLCRRTALGAVQSCTCGKWTLSIFPQSSSSSQVLCSKRGTISGVPVYILT